MAIRVVLPSDGSLTFDQLPDLFDGLILDSTITRTTTTFFGGNFPFDGNSVIYSVNGSGFTFQSVLGQTVPTGGNVSLVSVSLPSGTLTMSGIDVDLKELLSIAAADASGSQPLGLENFLLGQDWDVTLTNGDDRLSKNMKVGDGARFNPIGDDRITGLDGDDVIFSGSGNDTVNGDDGNDRIDTGAGNDIVFAGNGDDVVNGGKGKDKIYLGVGNDIATGGGGADIFVFGNNQGTNRIRDFAARNNREDIDLGAVAEITGYKDLKNHHMEQRGGDVVIDDGAGTVIRLLDTDLSDLGKGDFLF